MEKKNLIIGGFTNYNYNQLKPWVESIDECGFTGDKVMVVGNASKETKDKLIEKGFILVDMPQVNLPIHVARFISIYDYLKNNWEKYEYVVTTDVKDVYFQIDPCAWLDFHLGLKYKLVAGSESIRYKDEAWGNDNLMQTYGPYIYDIFKDNIIYNVGTIGGKSEYVKDLVFNIFSNAINRPIPIVDQAVYNVLMNTQPYKSITLFASQADGWACQAGTTVDPSKIETFRPHLTESEPIWENGKVLTGQDSEYSTKGTPFCIVHQYDRVPQWKKFVQEKYNQDDPSQHFVYRTA